MNATDIAVNRLITEEGYRQYPYNDATGSRVSCLPGGNLSWLIGLNLETSGSIELAKVIVQYLVNKLNEQFKVFWWYGALDDARLSVIIDLAFNMGMNGLLHFPKMLAAIGAQNWQSAHDELLDSDAARMLPKRYQALAQILLSGIA